MMDEMIDLPALQYLELFNYVLQGDSNERRKAISTEPYNFKNTLTMKSTIV